ncbi:MAG TPA: hypothetical protein VGJ28_11745, partial [Micromonosporaceae bacterium]
MGSLRAAGLAGLLLVASLVPSSAASAAGKRRQPIPQEVSQFQYGNGRACHVDTAHHRVRVWWTEHHVPGRLPGSDGRCRSRPHTAALVVRHAERILNIEHGLGLPRPPADGWLGSENGGSGALDIYLGGVPGAGLTTCRYEYGPNSAQTGAYVMVAVPAAVPVFTDA